jgi:CheY-like chemotaxis protein
MSPTPALILLVDDEPMIRWIASDALEEAGYEVVAAENAAQALVLLNDRRDIALLFTDVNMPGAMDGLALAELVHQKWPAVGLVVTSGRGIDRKVPEDGTFLSKPYSLDELRQAIAEANRPPPRPAKAIPRPARG